MAKKQTFVEKAKKGPGADLISVKVIQWIDSPERGTIRCKEGFVRIKDATELNNI